MKKIIILFILISACKDSLKEERTKILTENGKTYWRVIFSDFNKDTSNGIVFLKNRTFVWYKINNKIKKRKMNKFKEEHPDIGFVKSEWNFPNDSIMNFGKNIPYKVIYFCKDSFKIQSIITEWGGWELIFYKEKDQISPIDTTIPAPVFPGI